MELPGGLIIDGSLFKQFELHTLTGKLELELAEITENAKHQDLNHPQWVSQVLHKIIASIGTYEKLSLDQINELCLADRQKIILSWRHQKNQETRWIRSKCEQCESLFDININLNELPFSTPDKDYPYPNVQTSQGNLRLRIPNGKDMQTISRLTEKEARTYLIEHLIESDIPYSQLNETDQDIIEASIENCVPELATNINAQCPYCEHQQTLDLNPYEELTSDINLLLDDVHLLASNYHWTEATILDLPRSRRQQYLNRISTTAQQGTWL